jgi:hypothetical protein
MKAIRENGFVFWRGPSPIDGAPLVAIATGLRVKSSNVKTGPMVQTWIMREDIPPTEAVKTGRDASVCGGCPLRGDGTGKGRPCYVTVFQAPLSVWSAYKRGSYADLTEYGTENISAPVAGMEVRIGSYGDPGVVPIRVWIQLTAHVKGWTGYTHMWKTANPHLSAFCMASVETAAQVRAARRLGYRTFRVGTERLAGEMPCPAGPKRSKVQCISCPVKCNGGGGASIFIPPHGAGAKFHPEAGR